MDEHDRHARLATDDGGLKNVQRDCRRHLDGIAPMKYETQKLALLYFWGALILFLAQVTFGVLAGSIYVFPNLLSETLPFNILRMIHTNALIVWLLLGFFGATYYLIPEEAERDIESPFIAKLQFWIFFIAAAVAVVGYLFRIHEGREFLEQPIYVKIAIVVAALLFLYNVSLTVLRGRKTVISTILLIGLWGIAIFFLFAFYNPATCRSTRCTGGGSCISGSKASGNW